MSIFGGNRQDRYHVEDYPDMHKFARDWQFEFADMLDCDEDEGYEEACDYWRQNHK